MTLLILLHTFGAISFRVNAANEPSDWAVTEINRAIEEGIVTDRVTKNYQKEITREEFCELAVQLYRKTAGKTITAADNPFTDTDNKEILKAYSLGIVSGVSETEFAPEGSVQRRE